MKNKLTTLCMLIAFSAISQKTDKVKIKYEFEMYPLETISKEKITDVNVSLDYAEKVAAAEADIAEKQKKAKEDKEDYDKKGLGQKFMEKKLLGQGKPSDVYKGAEFVPSLFPVSDIETMINVPGFTKTEGAKCAINAIFGEIKFVVNAARTSVTYSPLRVSLSVINDKGASVFQGDLPNNSTTMTYSANSEKDLNTNYVSTIKTLELNAKNAAVLNLNKYLSTNYGFNLMKDNSPFFDIKDKKFEYADYHQAMQKLENAFMSVNIPERQEKFKSSMNECITIWETNLKLLDKNDKNAKINADVAAATTLNLALAFTWLKDFDKAYDYLAEHKALDKDYSNAYSDITTFVKEYNKRYNKYAKY